MENEKEQLQKLAKIFNTGNVITADQVKQVLTGIVAIMGSYKGDTQKLNADTKKGIVKLLEKVEEEHSSVLSQVESKNKKLKETVDKLVEDVRNSLLTEADVKKISDKIISDKIAKDHESLVSDVLSKITIPEFKETVLDGPVQIANKLETLQGDERLKVSALAGLEEAIDARINANFPNGRGGGAFRNTIGGGVTQIKVLGAGISMSSTGAGGRGVVTITVDGSGGGGEWGTITGTLSAQTDLQSALDLKYDASNPDDFISNITGFISQGSNVTITGTGTLADPYVIASSGGAAGATTALDNLASVAINTSLISDTDVTDDLGSSSKRWNNLFVSTIGATGTRITKLWATDITVTNAISGSVTGNAGTATALQNARTIGGVSFDGTANITVATATGGFTVSGGALALGVNDLTMTGSLGTTGARLTKGWFTDLQVTNAIGGSVTGNAATATALANARTIGGVSFDGTANITVATATGGFTVSGGNLALGTNSITMSGSIGVTGTRVTKVWTTDLESTNMPTVGGVAMLTISSSDTLTNKTLTTPVINGLPTGTGVASAATASTLASRDASGNLSAVNTLEGYTTTATAAGTTTLVVGSNAMQYFTGSTTQTVVMPVASTLVLGQSWWIVNLSSGAVTVNSSGANAIIILAGGTMAEITCILTSGTSAASWSAMYEGSSVTSAKKFSVSNTLTLAGTDGTTMTFPSTSATVARTDAANTFTGASTASAWVLTSPTITTKLNPTTNDGAPLGDTTHNWSDLFLATGAVINYANSNVVMTHSSGILTMGTGELRVTTAGTNTASVITQGSTNTLANKTLSGANGNVLGAVTMTLGSDADGDIYYRSSNVLTRLAKGTALQQLRMNAGATAPEWFTAAGGSAAWTLVSYSTSTSGLTLTASSLDLSTHLSYKIVYQFEGDNNNTPVYMRINGITTSTYIAAGWRTYMTGTVGTESRSSDTTSWWVDGGNTYKNGSGVIQMDLVKVGTGGSYGCQVTGQHTSRGNGSSNDYFQNFNWSGIQTSQTNVTSITLFTDSTTNANIRMWIFKTSQS